MRSLRRVYKGIASPCACRSSPLRFSNGNALNLKNHLFKISAGMSIKIGYWKVRALIAPIEYLLKVADVPFEATKYEFKGELGDEGLCDNWLADKEALGLEFPNIPYCIDGDVKITQSLAIMRYLGRKTGLFGIDESAPIEELARFDMIEQHVNDLRWNYINYCLEQSMIDFKFPEGFTTSIVRQLRPMSEYLGDNKIYLMGDNLSYIDMIFFEALDVLKLMDPDCCSAYPNLEDYYDRIRNLNNLKEFLESDECLKWPVCGPVATKWGWEE